MEEYAQQMIDKGFPKVLVERGVEFVKSGLKDAKIVSDDSEVFGLLQSFSLACYMAGARELADIMEAKYGNK